MKIVYTITENGINDKSLPTVEIHISGLNHKDMPTDILMKKINKIYSTVVALSCLNQDENFSNDQQRAEEPSLQDSSLSDEMNHLKDDTKENLNRETP